MDNESGGDNGVLVMFGENQNQQTVQILKNQMKEKVRIVYFSITKLWEYFLHGAFPASFYNILSFLE